MAPARGLAERGFPMYGFLRLILRLVAQRFETEWPSSAAIYLPLRAEGERQTNPPLGRFFSSLMDAERDASGSREARIRAARDFFYRGAPAAQIERFLSTPIKDASCRHHAGLLTAQDLARYSGRFEDPCEVDYRGTRVWKCGPWSQGPVFLQQLRLLEGFDMHAAGRRSAEALHLQIEASKLAYADREACYGDPLFTDVPLATLLSKEYASERRSMISREKASLELRPGMGRLPEGWPRIGPAPEPTRGPLLGGVAEPHAVAASHGRRDTTQLVAVDREGNVVVATPSGGWIPTSPVVPELGFPVGTRLQMAVLDPHHPNALAPGKRPRTTLSPSLARLPGGRMLGFGTPGGDQQDQWTLPFFLDVVDHGIANLQEAIDAPSVHSEHAPSSFYPRYAQPGAVQAEDRFEPGVLEELERRGHRIVRASGWDHGRVLAVMHHAAPGLSMAAASPRFQTAYAIAVP
jgi:gamma-glutamyltranspeptidase/glutathione hydrolase